jgi:DNA repair protein SbcD/Mre11
VDFAINNSVDLVVFSGDAYKGREPSQTQQREFARRINQLSTSGIPIFLLVGNHDLPNAVGKATSTEIFDTLAVKNVFVSGRPEVIDIPTRSGIIQVASLPWLRRSALLSKDDTKNLNFDQIKQKAAQVLTNIISAHAAKIDPRRPAILAAHVWVAGAQPGSEKLITIGQEHALMPGNLALPVFDYVALGHVHKMQVLASNPPVVYSGSLERVDFNEEPDEKGFYLVELDPSKSAGQRLKSFDFHMVPGRPFATIKISIPAGDLDPTGMVLKSLAEHSVNNAIIRLIINMPAEAESILRDSEIRNALKEAYYFTISKDIKRESRIRLGQTIEQITPIEALKTYLESKKVPAQLAKILLEYGQRLIDGQEPGS